MGSWNLSDIPPDVRALAEESAKRAGLSVGDWLTRTIHRQIDSEAAARANATGADADVTAAQAGAGAAPDAATTPEPAVFYRFLPSPLPAPRDIPVAALHLSRLHGETGLAQSLAELPAGNALAADRRTPIVARPAADGGGFEIITGIARWRAAEAAGRESVPALMLDLSNRELIRLILIEILTTTRIPAIAEAESFRWLLHRGEVSEDDLMEISGRARQDLRDRIALLSLPAPILERVDNGSLSVDLAPVFVDAVYGDAVSRIAIDHSLPADRSRAVVALTNDLDGYSAPGDIEAVERELGALLGTQVAITRSGDGILTLRVETRDGDATPTYRLQSAEVGGD